MSHLPPGYPTVYQPGNMYPTVSQPSIYPPPQQPPPSYQTSLPQPGPYTIPGGFNQQQVYPTNPNSVYLPNYQPPSQQYQQPTIYVQQQTVIPPTLKTYRVGGGRDGVTQWSRWNGKASNTRVEGWEFVFSVDRKYLTDRLYHLV